MTDRLFYKPYEDKEQLLATRKDSFKKGNPTGFKCLDSIASFLPKYQTLLFAPPSTGKSVIMMDILMAQAEMGRNVCIFSPEFRDRKELINALVQARLKKCFFGRLGQSISDDEYLSALEFINNHFIILVKPKRKKDGSQQKMTVYNIFKTAHEAAKQFNMKLDFLLIDPINYIERGEGERFMDTQDYVLNMYDQVAEFSELMDIHTILSAHTRDVELLTDRESGKRYYGVLHPSEVMGGQSNYRAAYQILHLWRAPEGVLDENGIPYPPNYTRIYNMKVKPFGTGRVGNTGEQPGMDGCYFDPDTFTMYEIVEGRRYYRNEYYKVNGGECKLEEPSPTQDEEDDIF